MKINVSETHERPLSKDDAVIFLEEALFRIKNPQKNHSGGEWQAGGCYWRLMKVLKLFVAPDLDRVEGKKHAQHLRLIHGFLTEVSENDRLDLEVLARWRELSARAQNCLRVEGLTTALEIQNALNSGNLRFVINLGKGTQREIEEWFEGCSKRARFQVL